MLLTFLFCFVYGLSSAQFSSNHNLWLYDINDNVFENVAIHVRVTESIVTDANGFTIQLNCLCPNNGVVLFQQFVISAEKNVVGAFQSWGGTDLDIVNKFFSSTIVELAQSSTVPAGWELIIELTNDKSGFITKVEFRIIDGSDIIGQQRIDLKSTKAQLAPISSLSLEIVGPANTASTVFTSGAGTFTYFVSNPTIAGNVASPQNLAFHGNRDATAETSNMRYGDIANEQHITQSFGV